MVLGKVWQACGILIAIGCTVMFFLTPPVSRLAYLIGGAAGVLMFAGGRIVCSLIGNRSDDE